MRAELRIIGGALGGRRLRAPAGLGTRPTADKVRQALFNILGPPPDGAQVLDLFAGSGALGLEALSRGAERAVFVEQDPRACQVLRDNLRALDLADRAQVLPLPLPKALRALRAGPVEARRPFDWVFADPPYAMSGAGCLAELLALLGGADAALLGEEAVVVVEFARTREDTSPGPAYGRLSRHDERFYGQTGLSFYGLVARAPAEPRADPKPDVDEPSAASGKPTGH